MTDKYTMIHAASDLESAAIDLEGLRDLLFLYAEHRERELNEIDPSNPEMIKVALSRQHLGESLLNAIMTEVNRIYQNVDKAQQRGYAAVQAEKEDKV